MSSSSDEGKQDVEPWMGGAWGSGMSMDFHAYPICIRPPSSGQGVPKYLPFGNNGWRSVNCIKRPGRMRKWCLRRADRSYGEESSHWAIREVPDTRLGREWLIRC